jgi:inhibitor of cysteine peptidase
MNRFAPLLIVAVVAYFLAVACHVQAMEPITIVEQDAGKTIQAPSGSSFNVVLHGNPTTGFVWEVALMDGAILKQLGEPSFKPESGAMGAGGKVTLGFQVVGRGQTLLRLIYHRPFESNVAPLKTFEVSVVAE